MEKDIIKFEIGDMVKPSPIKLRSLSYLEEFNKYFGIIIEIVIEPNTDNLYYSVMWLNNGQKYYGYSWDELQKVF